MCRAALAAPSLLASSLVAEPAAAHVGHLGNLAGHDHWVAGAAIGAAVLAGLWGAWKGPEEPKTDAPAAGDEVGDRADDGVPA